MLQLTVYQFLPVSIKISTSNFEKRLSICFSFCLHDIVGQLEITVSELARVPYTTQDGKQLTAPFQWPGSFIAGESKTYVRFLVYPFFKDFIIRFYQNIVTIRKFTVFLGIQIT